MQLTDPSLATDEPVSAHLKYGNGKMFSRA
jgi:hypothetical protein